MRLLGSRLRHRRRLMMLRQSDVAGKNSASFLSKVESGTANPSLNSLREWSKTLETSAAELIGDDLMLEAAKHSILLPERCSHYLDQLDSTPATAFLKELSASATSLSTPVPRPPNDPELQYLTAKVLHHRGVLQEAKKLAEKALYNADSPLLRISCLSLLCLIYGELAETEKQNETKDKLHTVVHELDYTNLLYILPDAEAISRKDLELLTLSALIQSTNLL